MKTLRTLVTIAIVALTTLAAHAERVPNAEIEPFINTSVIQPGAIPDNKGFFNRWQLLGNGPAPFTPVEVANTKMGKIQFVNHPLSFRNMKFEEDGNMVYPKAMCGVAVIEGWAEGDDSKPMPVCLALNAKDEFILIELVKAEYLPRLLKAKREKDPNVEGRHFADVSLEGIAYRQACDAYASFGYNDCNVLPMDFEGKRLGK